MPTRTQTKKIVKKKIKDEVTPQIIDNVVEESVTTNSSKKKYFILGIFVIFIALVLFLGKSYFLVAVVNNQPIFRWQLDKELEKRYGAQILDNLVTEKLINQEAQKAKINVTKEDIDAEIKNVTSTLPQGTDLQTALKAQGMTLEDFTKQVMIKLEAERILNPKITVTDKEIEEFASKSADMLTSSDSAKQKVEAETILRQQKLGEAFNSWLQEVESKAKIIKLPL